MAKTAHKICLLSFRRVTSEDVAKGVTAMPLCHAGHVTRKPQLPNCEY